MRILFILLLIPFIGNTQGKLLVNGYAQTPACSYIFDQYTGAVAGYSLRQLLCSYEGSCIRVRRSSDNTEQDIGFVSGNLDTATMKTFVGTGGADDGFVVTWYDQSGNANDATQSTAANQPMIMDNGVVLRGDVLPIIRFDGSNDVLVKTSFTGVDGISVMSIYIVVKQPTLAVNNVYVSKWDYATQGSWAWQTQTASSDEMQTYVASSITDAGVNHSSSTDANIAATFNVLNMAYDGGQAAADRVRYYKNNGASLTTSITGTIPTSLTTATSAFRIGQFGGALTRNFNGDFGEILIYPATSNRSNIFGNINTSWGAY